MTNFVTNVINQTNLITITNIIYQTNTITNVEIKNSILDWVFIIIGAAGAFAVPIIIVFWARADNNKNKKEISRKYKQEQIKKQEKEEQKINERRNEYNRILKEFIEVSKTKLLHKNINYNAYFAGTSITQNLKKILNGEDTEEIFNLLIHLKIIVYGILYKDNYGYKFTNMPDGNQDESYVFFLEYLKSVVNKINNNEYDDEIRKYINGIKK